MSMSEDLALPILKRCFPGAANMRIVHHQVEDGQRHGTSDVTRFIVEYDRADKVERQHLVMKVPVSGQLMSSLAESANLYNVEIHMYEKVLPRIGQHLDESLSPAHFCTTDSKVLVLEDLTARGYRSGEKLGLLDFAQTKAVMKAYARFHAASYKVCQKDPLVRETFDQPRLDGVDLMTIVKPWRVVLLELLRQKNEHGLTAKVEAAILRVEERKDGFSTLSDESNFEFVVLNHGDSRKENCLFKGETDGEVQVQLVDFQCCLWSTPAYDLCLFLSSSVAADVLEAHFDDLIREYLSELNGRLERLRCGRAYERAHFDRDFEALKFFFFYGFFVMCANNTPMNREQLMDVVSQSLTGVGHSYEHLRDVCLNDEQFVHSVYRWLKYFEKSNFFDQF